MVNFDVLMTMRKGKVRSAKHLRRIFAQPIPNEIDGQILVLLLGKNICDLVSFW